MQFNLTQSIIDAQKFLVNRPYDLAHDITHHYRVFIWCEKIVEAEKLNVDLPSLTIAAWWHDAQDRKGIIINEVLKSLKKNSADRYIQVKVSDLIKEHSFGTKQNSVEAKVLFDADKLEYVNPERLASFLQAVKDGFIPVNKYNLYRTHWNERIILIPGLLHFSYSQNRYKRLIDKAKITVKKLNRNFLT